MPDTALIDGPRLSASLARLCVKDGMTVAIAANRPTIIEVPVGVFPEPFDVIRPPATHGKEA